jgi:enterochelin esterase-like enzyme
VEPGFYNAWLQVRDVVLPAVSSQLKLHTGFTVVTTGHSLGGAISHYAGYEIRVANKNVSVDVV